MQSETLLCTCQNQWNEEVLYIRTTTGLKNEFIFVLFSRLVKGRVPIIFSLNSYIKLVDFHYHSVFFLLHAMIRDFYFSDVGKYSWTDKSKIKKNAP